MEGSSDAQILLQGFGDIYHPLKGNTGGPDGLLIPFHIFKVGPSEVSPFEVGLAEVGPTELGPDEIGPTELGSDEVGPDRPL